MLSFSRRALWTGIAAAAIFTTLGCEPEESAEPFAGTYIARIGETLIAVVVDEPSGVAVGYACDGREGRADPLAAWFNGTLADGSGELTGPHGSLSVGLGDGVASGELRLDGADPQPFDGSRSSGAGVLLWASTPELLGGWIFADDGAQRGAVLKRSIGDISVVLMNSQTTSVRFETTDLTIKSMTAPVFVE